MNTVNIDDAYQVVVVTEGVGDTTVVTAPSPAVLVETTGLGPQGPAGATGPKSVTIAEPLANDEFTLFRTQEATTFTQVLAIVRGSSPSITYELLYAANRADAGTAAIVAATATSTTTGNAATIQNQPIPSGRYVWVKITAVTGTVTEFNLSFAF